MRILEGFYSIDFDHERNIVHLSTHGFWTLEIVDQFARDLKHVRSIVGAHHDCLMDGARCEVHRPEVADALARLAQSDDHVFLGRTAMVLNSTLLKLQNRRFLGGERFGYFDNGEAALHWLAADGSVYLIRLPPMTEAAIRLNPTAASQVLVAAIFWIAGHGSIRCSCSRRRPSAAPH